MPAESARAPGHARPSRALTASTFSHLALEVKAGARYSPAWLSGLTAIGDLPRLARRVLVYTGTRELRTPEGIEVWPLAKLLTALAEGTLWP